MQNITMLRAARTRNGLPFHDLLRNDTAKQSAALHSSSTSHLSPRAFVNTCTTFREVKSQRKPLLPGMIRSSRKYTWPRGLLNPTGRARPLSTSPSSYNETHSTSSSPSSTAESTFVYNHPAHRPLSGTLVIALEQVISGPYCTRQLADLGARVIKIERPGTGDFVRYHDKRVLGQLCSHFVWTNRNKESLALDIKNEGDLRILKELVKKADVFVQNLIPGATERHGLGYEELKKTNERLIMCEISGYGSDGPYKTKKAYDLLVQSEAGVLSITGTPDTPSKFGCSIADISAGMYAYSSIMAALLQREKTGKGCRIDVSMLEGMVEWTGFPMYYAYEGQKPPQRAGASHASIYPYGPFKTGSGKIMLGLQNEREWAILCEKVLEMPELIKDDRFSNTSQRSDHRDELFKIMCERFSQWTADQVVERLEKAGIANARLNEMKDIWEHPQLHARKRFSQVETEAGTIKTLIPPGMSGDVEARLEAVPAIGQHTEQILAEFGLSRTPA